MVTVEIKIDLPDRLARDTEAIGLLTPQAIASLIREEVRRQIKALFEATNRPAVQEEPPMTEEEVLAEIQTYRREKRASHAR
ncbi:MAG: hypothetical protein IRY99_23065 [Isosphaeraceae bacterium]|nr:hypothetical protein [Isosphaeraceae bacterium]